MSVNSELLCSFELLKPLDSNALKTHIKKQKHNRKHILNSPVRYPKYDRTHCSGRVLIVYFLARHRATTERIRLPPPPPPSPDANRKSASYMEETITLPTPRCNYEKNKKQNSKVLDSPKKLRSQKNPAMTRKAGVDDMPKASCRGERDIRNTRRTYVEGMLVEAAVLACRSCLYLER